MKKCAALLLAVALIGACGDDTEKEEPIVLNNSNNVNNVNNINNANNVNNQTNNLNNTNNQTNNLNNTNNVNNTNNLNNVNNTNNVSTADEVDPNCVDGMYSETLPNPNADISAELASYSEANLAGFYDAVLEKRYPVGAWVVRQGLTNPQFDCVDAFSSRTSTAEGAIGSLSTVVHECGHVYNFTLAGDGFGVTPDLQLSCTGGDTTSRGGETFARSRLRGDDYNQLRPGCDVSGEPCDFYAEVYLDGDPDDGNFDGGDQGFNSVLEETLQYVNSVATSYAFQDFIAGSTSAMDGILTFLWYIERYLRMARLQYPDAYAKLSTDPCWRNAILTVWGRAWLMLEQAEGNQSLGIDEQALFELVRDPELLGEIQRLRDLEGC